MDSATPPVPNMRLVRVARVYRMGGGWIIGGMIGDVRVIDAAWRVIQGEQYRGAMPGSWWVPDHQIERIAEQIPAVRWKLDTRRAFEEAASG